MKSWIGEAIITVGWCVKRFCFAWVLPWDRLWMEDLRVECPPEREVEMGSRSRNGVLEAAEVRRVVRIYRKVQVKLRSSCVVCGRRWRWWSRFHVHHKFPVARFPEEAANARTFRWVHARCHLVVGHGGRWSRYQAKFDEVCNLLTEGLNPELSRDGKGE